MGSLGTCLPALSLTRPPARSLFTAGVHANFSTTIPPTSWQADLPPHHPSSACSDGTLKLSTAASTEGMAGYGGRTGSARGEPEVLASASEAPDPPARRHLEASDARTLCSLASLSFQVLRLERPFLRMSMLPTVPFLYY